MASYQHILFEHWTSEEVANWLQGLDDSVAQYVSLFKKHEVNGRKLLMLNHSDLEKMDINKLGHQELVLEAVDLLRALRYTLDTENLQSMALQLGCKARNLVAEILMRQGENDQNRANRGELQRKRLSVTVLSYVADLLATLKNLVSWLDRAPFEGIYDICRLRNFVVKLGLELVTVTQRESSYVNPEDAIIKSCRVLIEQCNGLVQNTKDPLVIQPAALEQATIRKKQGEELGMNIQSAYNGIHGISSIKDLSPADMCSKIEKGDEVLQVNGQTVLGWQLKELVKILKDRPKEVTLLLKKRPRHINPLGAMQNHKKLAAKHAQQAATLPKSLKKRRSREGDVLKQVRPSLQEYVSGAPAADEVFITKDTSDPPGDGNDTDNDVFRSGSESPQYTLPVMPDAKQRRATVSGGSPTFERNSLMVEDPVIRPKSQVVNQAERDAALAVLAAAENNLKTRVAESGVMDRDAVESGGEDGAAKAGSALLRKTSSESSGGQKGPSESEMEDSVFSSDKEDKEQQNAPIRAGTDAKWQEFRVTKPTPMLLEPNSAAATTPTTPVTPTPNTPTPITPTPTPPTPSPQTPTPTPNTATPAPNKPPPPTPLARNSSTSSSVSSASSSSTIVNSPGPVVARRSRSSGSVPPPVPPRKPSLTKPAVPAKPTLDRTRLSLERSKPPQDRPPSPVSAPPKRKTAMAFGLLRDGNQDASVKSNVSVGDVGQTGSVSEPFAGTRSASTSDVDPGAKPSSATSLPRENMSGASNPTSSGVTGSEPCAVDSALLAKDVNSEMQAEGQSPREIPRESASTLRQAVPEVNLRGDKGNSGGVLEAKEIRDTRSQAVQMAIHTEVATDVPSKDMPQLMKIKKLESPKATDGPNPLSTALAEAPKQKKKVEFSADSKESSPPPEVSYTHIVVGGVVQKIPVERAPSDSSKVEMRPKNSSAGRRLDRRVSCKDLGKGDCEGWLYKRKEKDRALVKQWSKRWCVLKNSNLYYYKNKDDLKAEGVIFLPAFQVSPAPNLKTKKLAFKVHNSGTTFYFASERQDDMSKWMNKMGLAAISFDPSHTVTTAGFIKPEVRSNHLGVASNAAQIASLAPDIYYSESEDEVEDGATSKDGSTLSLNSLSSQGSGSRGPPPPTAAKPILTAFNTDPGGAGSGSVPHHQAAENLKEDQCPQNCEDLHSVLLRAIHSQDLTIDGVDRNKRRTQHLSSELVGPDKKVDGNIDKMRHLLALNRTVKVKEQEVQDIDRLLASHITASRLRDFFSRHPSVKKL